ncbi:bacterial sugar transferase [Aeromicrobium marinum DSM 15272]|uniref:Bacterial sugar transferase n=1 Tax=Aeromicrobium marinum DSM 15272 TaxID=585531 RepID=E2S932_9ACTN|nr:sugar transferase [Aeromicrobium marinum]EFQ84302.1 bacterial sugar transferase [Aeromicrobium marinum DSM 15272]
MKMKRALDLVLVLCGAIVWVPVLTVAALAVLIGTGRPVLYRSMRRIDDGQVVRIVKFRTMVKNAEKLVNRDVVPVENQVRFLNIPADSPLYTSVGRLLERCGITELPQFVHVIRGQMSIIGNRPLPENVMRCLREEYADADDRFLTKAGLTGPAQLVGRDVLTDAERLRLEGAYCRACIQGYSVRLDLAILLATVGIVIGIKKGLDYQGVLDLIERHSRRRRTVEIRRAERALPATVDAAEVAGQ